jgi:hypothetical protein
MGRKKKDFDPNPLVMLISPESDLSPDLVMSFVGKLARYYATRFTKGIFKNKIIKAHDSTHWGMIQVK